MLKTVEKLKNGGKAFIVCTGDSITEQNYHFHGKLNYVGQLWETLLNTYGRTSFVLNTAVSGETTWKLMRRLDEDVLRFKPDLVTLMIGINDSKEGMEKLPEFRQNMYNIIERIRGVGAEILLLTENPISFEIENNISRKYYPEYVKAIRQTAKDYDVSLCDIYDVWEKRFIDNSDAHWTLMNDTLHPNEYGHDFMAEVIFDYLNI